MSRFCFALLPGLAMLAYATDTASTEPVRKVVRTDSNGRLQRVTIPVQPRVIRPIVVREDKKESDAGAVQLAGDASVNEIIDDAAKRHNVDPLLVHSVIQVESAYNRYAVSKAGAQGMMQLIPSTARTMGVKNPFDARENIEAGVRYLKQLQQEFKDDRLALAAYNAGPGAVVRYGNIPPYSETQNYVYQVGKRLGDARRAQQQTAVTTKKLELPKKIEQYVDSEGRLHLKMP